MSPKLCDFYRFGDSLICRRCERVVSPAPTCRVIAHCRWKPEGPGAALKALLAKFGIHATPTCKCNKMARQMDAWGPEECLNHIEEIVDVMEETAKKRKLPFLRTVGRLLVRKAIRTAKKAATGT